MIFVYTYEAAVELFAMLCKKYSLDPLADGVVISHKEGHSRGNASNHGFPSMKPWTQEVSCAGLFHELMNTDAFGCGQPTEWSISPFTVIFLPAV